MSDPKIAQILDRPNEQKKFHARMLEFAKDKKVDIHDMKKFAYELAHGKVEDISSTEGQSIAREIFPDSSRRYIADKPEQNNSAPKPAKVSEKNRSKKVPPVFFAYRAKTKRTSSPDLNEKKNPYTGFYNAMQSVSRNRKPQ